MDIKDNIMNGLSFIGETVSELAASVAEKNRIRSQLNHLKQLIKADSATRDQAYIELGRFFYENLREGASPENEAICAVIDATSDRISSASMKYMELLNLQNETHIRSENAEKLKKAVAERASAAAKAAREKGAELAGKAKDAAGSAVNKAKEAAAGLRDKAADAVEDVRERLNPDGDADVEELIAEEQRKLAETEDTAAPADAEAPADCADCADEPETSEESPDSCDF